MFQRILPSALQGSGAGNVLWALGRGTAVLTLTLTLTRCETLGSGSSPRIPRRCLCSTPWATKPTGSFGPIASAGVSVPA